MEAIKFSNVTKVYDNRPVVDGLSFDVHQGEITSIVGPSGVGKSTLLKLITGIEHPSTGQIFVYRDLPSVAARNGYFGYAFQEDLLLPWLTVSKNISLPLEFTHLTKSQKADLVQQHCARVDLVNVRDQFPHELSGGQRRRTVLARATIHNPKILLMDEPFSALDEPLRRKLLSEYQELILRGNITALLVTHSVDEAIYFADSVRVMTGHPANGMPGRVSHHLQVPFSRPRTEALFSDPVFIALKEELLQAYQCTPPTEA